MDNKIYFLLLDPDRVIRECLNLLDDISSVYKFFNLKKKNKSEGTIVKHLSFGIPGGRASLEQYPCWIHNEIANHQYKYA